MNTAEFLHNLGLKTGEKGIVGNNPIGENWRCDNREVLRGIRDSKKKKVKGRRVGVMIIEHYYWEEGLAGIIKGRRVEVKVRNYRGKLWEKTAGVSSKEKEEQGWGVAQKGTGSIAGYGVKRRVGKSLADSSSQMAPTGLKTRGGGEEAELGFQGNGSDSSGSAGSYH